MQMFFPTNGCNNTAKVSHKICFAPLSQGAYTLTKWNSSLERINWPCVITAWSKLTVDHTSTTEQSQENNRPLDSPTEREYTKEWGIPTHKEAHKASSQATNLVSCIHKIAGHFSPTNNLTSFLFSTLPNPLTFHEMIFITTSLTPYRHPTTTIPLHRISLPLTSCTLTNPLLPPSCSWEDIKHVSRVSIELNPYSLTNPSHILNNHILITMHNQPVLHAPHSYYYYCCWCTLTTSYDIKAASLKLLIIWLIQMIILSFLWRTGLQGIEPGSIWQHITTFTTRPLQFLFKYWCFHNSYTSLKPFFKVTYAPTVPFLIVVPFHD